MTRTVRSFALPISLLVLAFAACSSDPPKAGTLPADASLSVMTFSAGSLSPTFDPATLQYTLTVPNGTTALTVTAQASDAAAQSIAVVQDLAPVTVASDGTAALTVPAVGVTSSVTIRVTAADGKTASAYGVEVTQLAPPTPPLSSDATLSALAVDTVGLTGFSPTTLSYPYSVANGVESITVTPTAGDAAGAAITVNGTPVASGSAFAVTPLQVGDNAVTIVVTAQDGTTTQTYTLTVTQGPLPSVLSPAKLATGVPVDTILRIAFDEGTTPTIGTAGTVQIFKDDGTLVDSINMADPYAVYDGTDIKEVKDEKGNVTTPAKRVKKLTKNLTSSKVNLIGGLDSGRVRLVNFVPITVSGNTVTIYPHNNKLEYNTNYYVTIGNGFLNGTVGGMPFAGLGARAWTFTTKIEKPTTFNVAADNSADYATVQGAIDAVPMGSERPPIAINISPGVYEELLFIGPNKPNITLQGADRTNTVIQYDNWDGFNPGTGSGVAVSSLTDPATGQIAIPDTNPAGLTGGGRAVLLVQDASGIALDNITIRNTHAQNSFVIPTLPTSVTVAKSDKTAPTYENFSISGAQAETIFFNSAGTLVAKHSSFVSYQDTIQVKGWSWFYDCFITGDVDFIWGNANAALFERCEIKSRYRAGNPGGYLVQSRTIAPPNATSSYPGFVFLNCALTKEDGDFTVYLARSPGDVSSGYDIVSYIGCTMDSHVAPVGWTATGSSKQMGANTSPTAIAGWREYGSLTPAGALLDVSARLVDPQPALEEKDENGVVTKFIPGGRGSLQLTPADVATFFPNRATIFGGATNADGTLTLIGNPAMLQNPGFSADSP